MVKYGMQAKLSHNKPSRAVNLATAEKSLKPCLSQRTWLTLGFPTAEYQIRKANTFSPLLYCCTSIFIGTAWDPICYSIVLQYICFQPILYMCDSSIQLDCHHSCLLTNSKALRMMTSKMGMNFTVTVCTLSTVHPC